MHGDPHLTELIRSASDTVGDVTSALLGSGPGNAALVGRFHAMVDELNVRWDELERHAAACQDDAEASRHEAAELLSQAEARSAEVLATLEREREQEVEAIGRQWAERVEEAQEGARSAAEADHVRMGALSRERDALADTVRALTDLLRAQRDEDASETARTTAALATLEAAASAAREPWRAGEEIREAS